MSDCGVCKPMGGVEAHPGHPPLTRAMVAMWQAREAGLTAIRDAYTANA